MGKYEEYVRKFNEDYEQPVAEEYIVGFSGIDPDRKIKPETINHEKLDGLLGGDFAGRYHISSRELASFRSYQGQINTLSTNTAEEFALVRKEASDGLKAVEEDAHERIDALRQSTHEEITSLSATTEAEISRVERETQSEIERVDFKTVQAISNHKAETARAINQITGEVSTFTAQAENRMAAVERRNEEITAEQEQMTGRYEAAMSELTEDSEVIDARVSEDGREYVTLGGRLRAMDAVSSRGLGTLHESDAGLWDAVQEVSEQTGSTLLEVRFDLMQESSERQAEDAEIRQDISRSRERMQASHEHMQEQTDTLTGLTLKHELNIHEFGEKLKAEVQIRAEHDNDLLDGLTLEEETRRNVDAEIREEISHTRDEITARGEYLQEQANELAREMLRVTFEREEDVKQSAKDTDELRLRIGEARQQSLSGRDHLQAQANELAGEILRLTFEREADQAELPRVIAYWQEKRQELSEHMSEQLGDLSSGVITNAANLQEGLQDASNRRKYLSDEIGQLREEVNTNAYTLMDLAFQAAGGSKYEPEETQIYRKIERLEAGENQRQKEVSQSRRGFHDAITGLQEQINELACMKLNDLQTEREMNDRIAVIEADMDAILREIDPEYEPAEDGEIDDMIDKVLSGEEVTGDGEYYDPEFDGMIDEIFGVNP